MANTSSSRIAGEILRHRKPPVAHLEVVLPNDVIERVRVPTGRFRARDTAHVVEQLGGDVESVRMMAADGSILGIVVVREPAPVTTPPPPVKDAESAEDRALRIVGDVYARAFGEAARWRVAAAEEIQRERELAEKAQASAMSSLISVVERAATVLTAAADQRVAAAESQADADVAAVEAAAAAEASSAEGGVIGIMKALPAAMPSLMTLAQAAGAGKSG